ncbi:MFS transporter [Sphingosinicella sp. CPCC 101087]|uniref:MFS transporter n=1 Tax=Sphingosinicella sp. CPCC 101087 TaxID=2497754 RepID=UPI00101CDAAE|nr:MFS transporter [Sphingosinicella sp. CPCC 101087]
MPLPSPFAIANFRYYWVARLTTMLGQSAMLLIVGWQVYNIARLTMSPAASAAQIGFIGLIQFVPLFLLTPVTGWLADHVDRRHIARATTGLLVLSAVVLGAFTWADAMTLPVLFVVAGLLGIARAFSGPALGALAPNLVPREILPNAIALSSIAWQAGMIAGPAIGGYLYAWIPAAAYGASAALFLLSLLCLLLIGPVPRPERDRERHPVRQMVDGLSYVRTNRLVLGAITLDLFAVFLAGATALLPVYARDILEVGPEGLAQLGAAPAVGAALTALFFTFRPLRSDVGMKMLGAVVVFGAATVAFGLSRWMPLSLAALFVIGSADMFSVYVRQSLIQLHTPDAMRGRVGAVSQLTISASNELGDAQSGFLAALIGPVAAVVAGGAGAVAVTLLYAARFPELRRARSFDEPTYEEKDSQGRAAA